MGRLPRFLGMEGIPHTLIRASDSTSIEAAIEWIPTVYGRPYAVHAPGGNRINGIRTKPPKDDPPHLHTD